MSATLDTHESDPLIIYKPSRWQEIFHNLDVTELMGGGSAGPGKSYALLMDPIPRILREFERQQPGYTGPHPVAPGRSRGWCLHLRRTRPMLNQTLARARVAFEAIDPGVHWDGENTTFTFSCGYRYEFGHCKDPDSWVKYYSNEYDWIGFDELTQFTEKQYDEISSRLRSSDPVLRYDLKIRSCTNPVNVRKSGEDFVVDDPNWVRRRFVEPAGTRTMGPPDAPKEDQRMWWDAPIMERVIGEEDGKPITRTWMFLPATLEDNPDPEFRKLYRRNLLAMKPHRRKALLDGDWWVTPNSFYAEEWNSRIHVCDPFRIPKEWKVFRSMDWGFKMPGVIHWWAMNREETLYCIKEVTFKGKTDKEVAQLVLDVERGLKLDLVYGEQSLITGPADTQLWEERGDSGKTKAQVFAENGVGWVKAAKGPGSRQRNAEHLMKRLKEHEQGHGVPGIVFFRSCGHIVGWIPSVDTDPDNSEQPVDNANDHHGDSSFYACAFASRGWKGIPERVRIKKPWERGGNGSPPPPTSGNRMSYHG